MQHRVSNRFLRAAHGFFAWRLHGGRGVAQLMKLRAKLNQSTFKRIDSIAEPGLGQPAILEREVVALDGRLGTRDLGLQSPLLGCGVGSLLSRA